MTIRHIPDPALAERLSNGDETAFRQVFDCFHKQIYRFAFGFLKDKDQCDEVVQDTFLQFWLHRHDLNPNQAIAPLLFTISRRILIDAWRKAASSERCRKELYARLCPSHNDTEEQVWVEEIERIKEEAFDQLNRQQQQVFILSREEGLSYAEIAEKLHISKNTVKYHLMNALKIMRTHFNRHDIIGLYFLYFILHSAV